MTDRPHQKYRVFEGVIMGIDMVNEVRWISTGGVGAGLKTSSVRSVSQTKKTKNICVRARQYLTSSPRSCVIIYV